MWVIIYALEQSMQQLAFDREDVENFKRSKKLLNIDLLLI